MTLVEIYIVECTQKRSHGHTVCWACKASFFSSLGIYPSPPRNFSFSSCLLLASFLLFFSHVSPVPCASVACQRTAHEQFHWWWGVCVGMPGQERHHSEGTKCPVWKSTPSNCQSPTMSETGARMPRQWVPSQVLFFSSSSLSCKQWNN